ncbi:enoyl-CoA hydratase/isomerase family protein [Dactylosporangium fulvum]|uniref:Enoyl-CoA hydratase/isomerase family protein n=1 Tax=Dactylosporangium fulvum TaxID=53359 RepID=A0ABY5W6B6_9ACTN|nr:enoyl-CoA hydratase/isomerase family protein [Dactylosporangium fulvum]UWP85612.1 enoyl-CoA hydratase/isomerase family protein [Dactylosporangium fulvum]
MDLISLRHIAERGVTFELDDQGFPVRPLVVVDLDDADWRAAQDAAAALDGRNPVLVGVATSALPAACAPLLERMTCTLAPDGPGRYCAGDIEDLGSIAETVGAAPYAAVTLAELLEVSARCSVADGLLLESFAYSMLLAGPEFTAWRKGTPRRDVGDSDDPVVLERSGDTLAITLNRPDRHNAFGRAIRDGLLRGLDVARQDPSVREVVVSGAGRSFCSGGDLDEFGTAPSVSAAHLVRLHHSAGHAVHQVRDRARFVVHGACIGAGVEIPSFAGSVAARDDAYFQLPELRMGLIPGAGGTVSVTRRIGRWRTAYMALTNRRVDVSTALRWGLVDSRA